MEELSSSVVSVEDSSLKANIDPNCVTMLIGNKDWLVDSCMTMLMHFLASAI